MLKMTPEEESLAQVLQECPAHHRLREGGEGEVFLDIFFIQLYCV